MIKNIFIEFYGGYYKAWKRKVLKNKLYKKYKIPVIVITPAELGERNFEKKLLREMTRLSRSKISRSFKLEKWQLERAGISKYEINQ